jgi:holo-[acyl-carrier protein] synthase
MLVGIGLDLVELSRVGRSLARWDGRLLDKLMDAAEAARLPATGPARVEAVATAIALKEAASKALGTGWSHGVFWRHVIADPGPPVSVRLTGEAAVIATRRGSSGTTSAWLETRGDLLLAEVWLHR